MLAKSCTTILLCTLMVAACGDDAASPSPAIYMDPGSVTFTGEAGGSNPAAKSVRVLNTGGGSLSGLTASTTYPAGQPQGWLTATLSQGAAPATLMLAPSMNGLTDGTYTATVQLSANGARNAPQMLEVSLAVAKVVVTCVPAGADFACTFRFTPPAGAPAVTAVAVPGEFNGWNPGNAPMTQENGVWSRTYTLARGEYQYKFHINGNWVGNMCNDQTWGDPTKNFWVHTGATGCRGDNAYILVQ